MIRLVHASRGRGEDDRRNRSGRRLRSSRTFPASDELPVARFERLGGLTNRVFKVSAEGAFCLRLPGEGTEAYINRKVERANAAAAAAAGVSPDVLFFGDDGVMIARFLHGSTTMSAARFHECRRGRARSVPSGSCTTRSPTFAFRFELFAMIDDYLASSCGQGRAAAGLSRGRHEAAVVRARLGRHPGALRPATAIPCARISSIPATHVDRRLGIFRHERSDVGSRRPLGRRQASTTLDRRLIATYFGGRRRFDYGRMVIYKAMCDLVDALGPDPARQQDPGRRFLGLCREALRALQVADASSPDFSPLDAVSKGP